MRLLAQAKPWLHRWRGNRRDCVVRAIPNEAVCAEIGVWKGDFSAQILATGKPRSLHLVDPWRFVATYPRRWYGGAAARNQDDMDRIHLDVVRRFHGDPRVTIHREASLQAATHLGHMEFDWIYVDGDHSYDSVSADLAQWAKRIRPGGVLAGDDYTWRDEDGALPVERAVQDFIATHPPRKLEVLADQYLIWL